VSNIVYRKMKLEDVDAVAQLESEIFPTPWSRESFCKEVEENNIAYYIVALKGSELVGYGGLWHVITEMHITNIAVKQEYRGTGIGQGILTRLIERAENDELVDIIALEVRRSNFRAQNLYRKYGFFVVGVREKYYENNREDAYIMFKKIMH